MFGMDQGHTFTILILALIVIGAVGIAWAEAFAERRKK
jgi:hypothetical protein